MLNISPVRNKWEYKRVFAQLFSAVHKNVIYMFTNILFLFFMIIAHAVIQNVNF